MVNLLELTKEYKLVVEKDFADKRFKYLFVSIPEIGLVGLLALRHMIKKFGLEKLGYIFSEASSLMLRYENGEPVHNIRLYGDDDIVLLLLEIPVTPMNSLSIGKLISELSRKVTADVLVMLGSAPSLTRERKDMEELLVLGAPVGETAVNLLKNIGVEMLKNGTLTGPYAYVLSNSLLESKNSLILLSETYPAPITADPESAAKMLKVISKMIGRDIDVSELQERAEEIKLEMRKLHQLAAPTQQQKEIGDLYT